MSDLTLPGPCVICGKTDYPLSMGGPTICPDCDCGNFGQKRVQQLQQENERLRLREKGIEATHRVLDETEGQYQNAKAQIADLTSKLEVAERENTERTSVAKLKAIDWRKLQDRILEQAERIRTLESTLRCPQNDPIHLHFCTYCDSTLGTWHQSRAAQENKVTP